MIKLEDTMVIIIAVLGWCILCLFLECVDLGKRIKKLEADNE